MKIKCRGENCRYYNSGRCDDSDKKVKVNKSRCHINKPPDSYKGMYCTNNLNRYNYHLSMTSKEMNPHNFSDEMRKYVDLFRGLMYGCVAEEGFVRYVSASSGIEYASTEGTWGLLLEIEKAILRHRTE